MFQSTPPRRERRIPYQEEMRQLSFNPRPHEGSDSNLLPTSLIKIWFQSTPPRRERLPHSLSVEPTIVFQSTPPRRERPTSLTGCFLIASFNPRPHEGSDVKRAMSLSKLYKFQSTPPRRERQVIPASTVPFL